MGEKTDLVRRIQDYTLFGLGVGSIVGGATWVANNPPEHLLGWNNLTNGQLQLGYASIVLGAAVVAYGIERIIKYSKE